MQRLSAGEIEMVNGAGCHIVGSGTFGTAMIGGAARGAGRGIIGGIQGMLGGAVVGAVAGGAAYGVCLFLDS